MRWKMAGARWHLLFQSLAFSPPAQTAMYRAVRTARAPKRPMPTPKSKLLVSHHGGPSSGFRDLAWCVAIGKRPYCRGGSGLRGGSGWRDGGGEGGLGDAGGRDGSGSRAGMKLPPKRKATPSSDHCFPFAFGSTMLLEIIM
jgi:hypothetical protein